MSLRSLKKTPMQSTPDHGDDRSELQFQARLAMQQFLKHQGPLFTTYARSLSGSIAGAREDFEVMARQARELAFRFAAIASSRPLPEIRNQDARFFRREAAIMVASAWSSGRVFDIDQVEREVGSAIRTSCEDTSFFIDDVNWEAITPEASRLLSRIAISAQIARTIASTYTFRQQPADLARRLSSALEGALASFVEEVSRQGHDDVSGHTIRQTASRNFCDILCATYRRHAEAFLREALKHTAEERARLLRESDHVGAIVEEFGEWTRMMSEMAISSSQAPSMPTIAEETPEATGMKPA